MPSQNKPGKASGKKPSPTKRQRSPFALKPKKKAPPKPVEPPSEKEDDEEEDSDDEGVDEEGMARLMKALGDEGLDDFDRAQLKLALGDSEDNSEDEDEDEEGVNDAADGQEVTSDADEAVSETSGDDDGDGEEEEEEDNEDEAVNEDEDENEDGEDDDPENEEDVLLEDVDHLDDDIVPRQKIEIDNKVALERIRESFKLDPSLPWTETLVISYPNTIDVDVNDDLKREVAFYKQALHSADAARTLAAKHKLPFTRPSDYFAEMVKSDSHMERIRQRLLDETAGIKKSEDKRKEREGKKFGKQVQIEKLKEREQSKKDMEERLKGLKRKRKDILDNPQGGDDDFDIAVEDAISERPAKRGRGGKPGESRLGRHARDKKYGFGGDNRRSKQNTRESTDDFGGSRGRGDGRGGRGGARGGRGGGFGGRGGGGGGRGGRGGGRGGSKRLGKDRRITARSRT